MGKIAPIFIEMVGPIKLVSVNGRAYVETTAERVQIQRGADVEETEGSGGQVKRICGFVVGRVRLELGVHAGAVAANGNLNRFLRSEELGGVRLDRHGRIERRQTKTVIVAARLDRLLTSEALVNSRGLFVRQTLQSTAAERVKLSAVERTEGMNS